MVADVADRRPRPGRGGGDPRPADGPAQARACAVPGPDAGRRSRTSRRRSRRWRASSDRNEPSGRIGRGRNEIQGEHHGRPTEQEVAVQARHAPGARFPEQARPPRSSPRRARRTFATTSRRRASTAARRSSRRRTERRATGPFIAAAAMKTVIAVDAMGGDHGPAVTVPACLDFLASHGEAELLLVGLAEPLARRALARGRRRPRPGSRSSPPPRWSAWTRTSAPPSAPSATPRCAWRSTS